MKKFRFIIIAVVVVINLVKRFARWSSQGSSPPCSGRATV